MVELNDLEKIVASVSFKYSKSIKGMEIQDLMQELWVHMLIKRPNDIRLAQIECRNKAIDLYRLDHRISDHESIHNIDTYEDEITKRVLYNTIAYERNEVFDEFLAKEIIESFSGRERTYVIAKCYYSSIYMYNLISYLQGEINKLIDNLSKDRYDNLVRYNKIGVMHTDKAIAEVFLDITSSSSSMRKMKYKILTQIKNYGMSESLYNV